MKASRLAAVVFHHLSSTNVQSATVRPEVISSFLEAELCAGRVLRPVDPELASVVQVNRFGLVSKPDRWRLIVDLYSLKGCSVDYSQHRDPAIRSLLLHILSQVVRGRVQRCG